MNRYCKIKGGQVESVILWDGVSEYPLASGETLVPESEATALPRPAIPLAEINRMTTMELLRSARVQIRTYRAIANPTADKRKEYDDLMGRVVIALTRLMLDEHDSTD